MHTFFVFVGRMFGVLLKGHETVSMQMSTTKMESAKIGDQQKREGNNDTSVAGKKGASTSILWTEETNATQTLKRKFTAVFGIARKGRKVKLAGHFGTGRPRRLG
jgi:hypothetical protein